MMMICCRNLILIFFCLLLQISSVTSMSFLTDQNLTFHRFSDGTISCEARKAMQPGQVWTTGTVLDYSTTNPTLMVNDSATSTSKILSPADEAAEDDSVNKRYSTYSSQFNNSAPSTPHPTYTGSTMKLIQVKKEDSSDSANKQVSDSFKTFPLRTFVEEEKKVSQSRFNLSNKSRFVTFER